MTDAATRRLRVMGIADTDSYVKWVGALLGSARAEWDVSLLILETPLVVSERQKDTALAGSGLDAGAVRRIDFAELEALLDRDPPDVVIVGARGPLVRVIARTVSALAPSAVIATGLPGVSVPATRKALVYRAQCDLFIVHSHRERRAHRAVAGEYGFAQQFALSTLPFAETSTRRVAVRDTTPSDLVFAAQALVPRERRERLMLAGLLVRAAQADPSRRVVVKVRAATGEQQTHRDDDALEDLIASLGDVPANLVVSSAPMRDALDTAEGLVTVSSTAAIEAVARGIPVIALDTFGVSRELINEVFEDSGLLGGEGAVCARRFRHPSPAWIRDNYLHDPADDDWVARVESSVALRRAGGLPARDPFATRGGGLREAWDRRIVLGRHDRSAAGIVALAVGVPLRLGVRGLNRVRGWIGGPPPVVSTAAALGARVDEVDLVG